MCYSAYLGARGFKWSAGRLLSQFSFSWQAEVDVALASLTIVPCLGTPKWDIEVAIPLSACEPASNPALECIQVHHNALGMVQLYEE